VAWLPATAATDVATIVADVIESTLMAVKDELEADRASTNASKSHVQFAPHIPLAQPDCGHFFCVIGKHRGDGMRRAGSFTRRSRACTAFVPGGG
jgi:hypothetical protein